MGRPGRPRQFNEERVTKALRISGELDTQLKSAARDRGVSVNLLINRAIEDYLDRLVPVDEVLQARSSA